MAGYTKAEIQEAGLDDFRVFLAQVWDFLGLPSPTPVQYDIAHWLQHGPRRLILMGFRGVGKSWITVAFALFLLFNDPQIKVMMVSASQGLADDMARFAASIIKGMPLLQHLEPRQDQKASALHFEVNGARESKDPSMKSAGITGQITGSRADVIIPDDIEIPKNSFTFNMREKIAELVKEFDAVLKPGGRIIYLGTPQVEDTLYAKVEKRGYKIRVWPSEIPGSTEKYHGRLAPLVIQRIGDGAQVHEPLDPIRFDALDLRERRASYGASGYALQFLLDTNPASVDKHPLKCHDLIVHDIDNDMGHVKLVWGASPGEAINDLACGGFDGDCYNRRAWASDEMAKYQGTVMAIDPSARGSDETSFAIVSYLHGMLYLKAVGGFTDGFAEDTLKALAAKMARYKVNRYIIERNYGGGMFDALIRPEVLKVVRAKLDEDWKPWATGMKEQRILDVLEPILASHRLVVDRRVIEGDLIQQEEKETYSFIQQMTRMWREKGALPHEDRLEAVGMACGYWAERMDRDQDKMLKKHKDNLLDAELRRHMEHIVTLGKGRPKKKGAAFNWRGRK